MIEIASWHTWVRGCFTAKVAAYVSAIFEEQRVGLVLGMALKKDEEALVLLDEGINARVCCSSEHTVSTTG
jgi:hypothetical protein